MNIKIYYDNVGFRLKEPGRARTLIDKVIREKGYVPEDLYFIFTTDNYLLSINREFLGHDYFTDVIAFNYNINNKIRGEVYIGIDTVRGNASEYRVTLTNEVLRVMIHGVLHLCGYDDMTEEGRNEMRKVEDRLLLLY